MELNRGAVHHARIIHSALIVSFVCTCFSLAGCAGFSSVRHSRDDSSDRPAALQAQIAALDEKISAAPDDAALLLKRARLLMDSGEAARALPDCEGAMKLQPSWMHARIQTGECLQDVGRTPDSEKLQVTKALVRSEHGHVADAASKELAREDRRIDANPDDPVPLVARARTLRELRQFNLALSDSEAALALDDEFAPAHLEASRSLAAIGRKREAEEEAARASKTPGR